MSLAERQVPPKEYFPPRLASVSVIALLAQIPYPTLGRSFRSHERLSGSGRSCGFGQLAP